MLNAWTSGSNIDLRWLITDQLGTPRMVLDQSGSLSGISRHDYLPFGEELGSPAGRTSGKGYTNSENLRQQFTAKERDVETSLDYLFARYYSFSQGRFTSTDPLLASASITDPQSFNRYAYARNSPLVSIDPNGLDDCQINKTCSFTTEDWATNGVHPEQGLIQETVIFNIPPVEPVPLETTSTTIAEDLILGTGQVVSDTAIGAGKSAYNTLYGAANLVNGPIDYGLSFFTDFQFGQTELYQASTPGEQSAMFGMMIVSAGVGGGAGAAGTVGTVSESTALVPMADAAFATGSVRIIAGYEVAGNAGLVGETYNVNVWGLYSTPSSQGLGALSNALRSEASAAGATDLNITGTALINKKLMNPATFGRAARMNGFAFRQVNPNSVFLSSRVP